MCALFIDDKGMLVFRLTNEGVGEATFIRPPSGTEHLISKASGASSRVRFWAEPYFSVWN